MIRHEFMDTVIGTPPEGWALGHFTIQLYGPEERLPIEAWRRGAFAIHERINRDEKKEAVLSHAPTGLRIYSFEAMDDAAECADRIESLTDWSVITKKFDTGSDLFPKVKRVVDDILLRPPGAVGTPLAPEGGK